MCKHNKIYIYTYTKTNVTNNHGAPAASYLLHPNSLKNLYIMLRFFKSIKNNTVPYNTGLAQS